MNDQQKTTIQLPNVQTILNGVTSSVRGLVGLLVVVFLGYFAWQRGWLDEAPKNPTNPQPVAVKIYGPAECLVGGEYYFHLEVKGEAGEMKDWHLVPDVPNALTIMPDQNKVRFQCTEPGTFSIIVGVGGDNRQVSVDHIEFENLDYTDTPPPSEQPETPTHPPVGPPPGSDMPPPAAPVPPTVAQLIRQAYDSVVSDKKPEEARIIAGSIVSIIKRIETGLLPPETDLSAEIEIAVEHSLGEQAGSWGLFVSEVSAILSLLRDQGDVTTAASAVPTLTEVVNVLQNAR